MLSEIISALKLITSVGTLETVKSIAQVASRSQSGWKRHVQSLRGRFAKSQWFKINAFSNELFEKIESTGISAEKLKKFKTVYTELTDNALQHSCEGSSKCQATILCTFSRWFIYLEVRSSGKGFDLNEAISKVESEREQGIRDGQSGLEVVQLLSDELVVRKNRVMVVIAGNDRISVRTRVGKLGNHEQLFVYVEESTEWTFLKPDWMPLHDVLERASQRFILVRFGKRIPKVNIDNDDFIDDSDVTSPTGRRRRASSVIVNCALNNDGYFAYVISEQWVFADFRRLQRFNLKFFRNVTDAQEWLQSVEHQQ